MVASTLDATTLVFAPTTKDIAPSPFLFKSPHKSLESLIFVVVNASQAGRKTQRGTAVGVAVGLARAVQRTLAAVTCRRNSVPSIRKEGIHIGLGSDGGRLREHVQLVRLKSINTDICIH